MRLDTIEGMATLRESISSFKPDIVCFDPLIDFHGSDENNAREMTATFRNLRILQEDYGFSTIMSHHIGKPDATGTKDGPDMLRGSSVIFAKGDSYMMLKPTNRNAGIIRVGLHHPPWRSHPPVLSHPRLGGAESEV
jgi:RecA-family ATPase